MPNDRRPWTLRGRLLRLFLIAAAGIWTLSGLLLFYVAERNNSNDWDIALRRSGRLLLSMVVHEYQEGSNLEEFKGPRSLDLSSFMLQVWDRQGRLILKSADAPDTRLIPDHDGFHNAHLGDLGPWRVAVLRSDETGLELLLAEHEGRRTRESNQLALSLLAPLILGLPLMGLIAWPFAARAIRPLSAASRSIAERRPNDLSLIPAGELPDEFQPLVDEFNGLLSRLVLALEGERRFASHVAHELRTPLASLRLNTQLLMARSGGTGTPELDAMSASIDRAARTIEQLIALARIELTQGNGDLADTTIDFARLIQETLNELTPLAKRRGVSIHTRLEGIEHARLPQALYLVLRNLLENAIKFARPDGTVIVSGHADTEHWWLQVEDDGPGLATDGAVALDASAARTAADSRRGLGLGLKMVYRTAELIGAEVSSTTGAILGGACLKIAGAASYRTSKASINDEPRSDRTALPATPLA